MDNGYWSGIEVSIPYIAEAKFSTTNQGQRLANRFYRSLRALYPSERIYTSKNFRKEE